ncbi:MAG: trigger factor [Lachnospiraceae bacterium]
MNKKKNIKLFIIIIAIIAVVIATVLICFAVIVPGNKKDSATKKTTSKNEKYDVYDYVKVGDYKGVKANRIIPEVTEEALQTSIQDLLESKKEYSNVKNRGMKSGDKVNIDFAGKIDGKEFDGGSAKSYEYEVGQGGMIAGFDEGLYGAKAKEKVTLNLTFPKDYQTKEVAGKDVVFEVTVNSIKEVSKIPEWNDKFAEKASEGKFKTAKEYEASIREELQKKAEKSSDDTLKSDVWNAVFANMKIDGYPENLYNNMYESVSKNIENSAAQWGMTSKDYLENFAGMTMKEYVVRYVESQMVSEALIDKAKLSLSDSEYKTMAEDYMNTMGAKSVEEMEGYYGKEALQEYFLSEKLYNYLVDEATITDVTQEEYDNINKKSEK